MCYQVFIQFVWTTVWVSLLKAHWVILLWEIRWTAFWVPLCFRLNLYLVCSKLDDSHLLISFWGNWSLTTLITMHSVNQGHYHDWGIHQQEWTRSLRHSTHQMQSIWYLLYSFLAIHFRILKIAVGLALCTFVHQISVGEQTFEQNNTTGVWYQDSK